MLELTLFLLLSFNIITGDLNNDFMINAYKDYKTTVLNVHINHYVGDSVYVLSEVNPIPRYVFETVDYNLWKMDFWGSVYLVALDMVTKIDELYRSLVRVGISLAHVYGISTWYKYNFITPVLPEVTRVTLYIKRF